jgi:hypothetical protein
MRTVLQICYIFAIREREAGALAEKIQDAQKHNAIVVMGKQLVEALYRLVQRAAFGRNCVLQLQKQRVHGGVEGAVGVAQSAARSKSKHMGEGFKMKAIPVDHGKCNPYLQVPLLQLRNFGSSFVLQVCGRRHRLSVAGSRFRCSSFTGSLSVFSLLLFRCDFFGCQGCCRICGGCRSGTAGCGCRGSACSRNLDSVGGQEGGQVGNFLGKRGVAGNSNVPNLHGLHEPQGASEAAERAALPSAQRLQACAAGCPRGRHVRCQLSTWSHPTGPLCCRVAERRV